MMKTAISFPHSVTAPSFHQISFGFIFLAGSGLIAYQYGKGQNKDNSHIYFSVFSNLMSLITVTFETIDINNGRQSQYFNIHNNIKTPKTPKHVSRFHFSSLIYTYFGSSCDALWAISILFSALLSLQAENIT